MENPQQLAEQFKKLGKIFNADKLVTPEDIEQVLSALVTILSNNKKEVDKKAQEIQEEAQALLNEVTQRQEELETKITEEVSSNLENLEKKAESKAKELIAQCMKLLDEAKSAMPKDGENAKPEDVVPLVLEKIKLPEYEKFALEGKGEIIVGELNSLPTDTDEFKIDVEHIKGLEKLIKKNQPSIVMGGGIVGRDIFKDVDLSDQLDGVTKTFNIAAVWNIISVSLSSYPYGALRKGVDYRWTPTTIEFLDTLDASTQLAAGQQCILTVVTA